MISQVSFGGVTEVKQLNINLHITGNEMLTIVYRPTVQCLSGLALYLQVSQGIAAAHCR